MPGIESSGHGSAGPYSTSGIGVYPAGGVTTPTWRWDPSAAPFQPIVEPGTPKVTLEMSEFIRLVSEELTLRNKVEALQTEVAELKNRLALESPE